MSGWSPASALRWLFDPEHGASGRLIPRWIFLRALGLIFYSAFFSLLPQIRGLIGPHGILPAGEYLQALAERFGHTAYWYAPTLFWFSGSAHTLTGICWAGMIASVLLVLNFWPRGMLAICLVCFLSFVSAAQDFSAYQSDGMLLEAGFISLFFAPAGFRPGWGEENRPSRASLFLPVWECFRIYFESGVAKIMGGDPQWRNFTALDEYYQNGPLPTWIGWYMQHLTHLFHAATAMGTLTLELGLAWMMFLPRRLHILCFLIITPWQIGIILSANYTFLNYLVLALGILLLDDRFVLPRLPRLMKGSYLTTKEAKPLNVPAPEDKWRTRLRAQVSALKIAVTAGADCRPNGGEFTPWRCGRAAAFCRQSVSAQAAAAGTRRDLAILVYHASGKTFTRNVVEEAATWPVRSHVRTTAGWKNCRLGVATCHGTTGMIGGGFFLLGELLNRSDMVALEADEDGFRGRLAVNPVFDIVAVGIALAHFVVGLADRSNELFAIHAHDGPAILDGLLHFRWQRIKPLHGRRALLGKIEKRSQELLQLIRR